jgi:type IV pilus assembly protein PilC
MPLFEYKLGTSKGNVIIKRSEAINKEALVSALKKEGYFVLSVRKVSKERLPARFFQRKKGVSNKDLQNFNKELLVLLRAGLPVVKSIQVIIEKAEASHFREILKAVMHDIEAGESTSEAFGKYSYLFSDLYIASLQAGETSGELPEAIEGYTDYLAKTEELRRKIVSASLYPVILTIFSISTVLFLVSYVVPSFTSVYLESGTTLPGTTAILLSISDGLKNNLMYIVLGLLAVFTGLKQYMKTEHGRLVIDHWKLSLPHVGEVFFYYSLTKVTRTLSTLLKAGIPMVESLHMVLPLLGNRSLENSFKKVIRDVEEGELFSSSLEKNGVFPSIAIQMIIAGETTGALTAVLPEITAYYENELSTKVGLLTSLIEPILMIIMGLLIGFILIGMYLPIFQMAGTMA